MPTLQTLSSRERCAVAIVAGVFNLAILSAVLVLFDSAARTPWFESDSALASAAQRCPLSAGSEQRHACLRAVAREADASTQLVAENEGTP